MMNSFEEAVEVAAQRWHERLWNSLVEDAQKVLETRDEQWRYFDDPAHLEEHLEDAEETVAFGRVPWETAEESSKAYARKQVRQTVLDALPAFLYAESQRAFELAKDSETQTKELYFVGGYLYRQVEEIEDEQS